MDKRLEIIGPYPPPLGGISIHISRMELFLKKEQINYRIYNHGYFSSLHVIATKKSIFWYIKYLFIQKGSLIHFHQFFKFHYFYYFIFCFFSRKKTIVTIHEENLLYYNKIFQGVIILLLKNTKLVQLILVSHKLSAFLNEKGINNIYLPAYIPPYSVNTIKLDKTEGKEYFLYSIWKVDKKIAQEIYNIELAFELLSKIKDRFHMLFLIGTEAESDKKYLSFLLDKYKITNSVKVIYEGYLVNYIENCKFLIRTNNIDGYGVSLQESIDLKVPAIASDVCIRPKGTILFKKGSIEDLYDKVMNINKFWNESAREVTDYHIQLLELYKKHLI